MQDNLFSLWAVSQSLPESADMISVDDHADEDGNDDDGDDDGDDNDDEDGDDDDDDDGDDDGKPHIGQLGCHRCPEEPSTPV